MSGVAATLEERLSFFTSDVCRRDRCETFPEQGTADVVANAVRRAVGRGSHFPVFGYRGLRPTYAQWICILSCLGTPSAQKWATATFPWWRGGR
jgi:hypothetical protein